MKIFSLSKKIPYKLGGGSEKLEANFGFSLGLQ